MKFKRYQHIERFGRPAVKNIEIGDCWIFPKIDGCNMQVYLDENGNIKAGSRNRELTLEKDHGGFYKKILNNENIKQYLQKYPMHRLYGEYLIPHTLKTYVDDAWGKFYIFDVCIDKKDGGVEYIPYNLYKPLLEEFQLNYIPPIMRITNASYDHFIKSLERNIFLIQEGKGVGEGIIIKNYKYYNKFGEQRWAKIVTSEFKEKHNKNIRHSKIDNEYTIEEKIIKEFCTKAFIEKEFAKFVNNKGKWKNKYIPELFNKMWHELITEEMWNIINKYNNPYINFKLLNYLMIRKIKNVKKDIFA